VKLPHGGWLAAVVLLGGPAPALAQEAAGDPWRVTVAPYVWATALDGHATVAGIKSDVDVSFSDILDNLAGAAMMLVDFEKGRFGVGVNGVYARLSPENDVNGIEIDATSDMVQLGVGPYYRLIDTVYRTSSTGRPLRFFIAPEAGFRFTYLRVELDVQGFRQVDQSESWVEPLIGTRVGLDLSDHWALAAEGNVGGFGVGSDLAWNVQGFLGYRTTLLGRETTFALGYRALSQDYDHHDFEWDVTMHGPVLGAAIRF
jgi:hypothetical protein